MSCSALPSILYFFLQFSAVRFLLKRKRENMLLSSGNVRLGQNVIDASSVDEKVIKSGL